MLKFRLYLPILFLLTSMTGVVRAEKPVLPKKQDFHLFLLAGQSNMAGRGQITRQDSITHPRVFMLTKSGEWVPAVDPIHYDKDVAGVGLGKSFALLLAEQDTNITIGLIPAACGGSPISTWQPGGYHQQTDSHPYDDAIKRSRHALQDGTLKAILWHQGESDSKPDLAALYQEKLIRVIEQFRKDLDSPDIPFILGQMGQFPEKPWDKYRKTVNKAHLDVASKVKNVEIVSSHGLACKSDKVHFDRNSLLEFGNRYGRRYLLIQSRLD